MNSKVCNKCNLEKNITEFEFQKDKNSYRGVCKECRNLQRRKKYQENKEEILKKKREYYKNNLEKCRSYRKVSKAKNETVISTDPKLRLKNQLIGTINNSFTRKGFKKNKNNEEILGCSINEAVEHLLRCYKRNYKKDWDGIIDVEIDHLIPIMHAHNEEQLIKLCRISNLQLLTKKENHRKGSKVSNGIGKNGRVKYKYFYDDYFDDEEL